MNNLEINTYYEILPDRIVLNNEPVEYCNGYKIQNIERVLSYFNSSRMFFNKEFNVKIKSFHLMQASNLSFEPICDINGNFSWERIEMEDNRLSNWVVTDFYTIPSSCSANMFLDSANLSRCNSAFRLGLLKTLPENFIKLNS